MIRAIIVILTFLPISGFACFSPPDYLKRSNFELVATSSAIVLATAIEKKEPDKDYLPSQYLFTVEEILKGKSEKKISILGFDTKEHNSHGDFEGHLMPEFWAYEVGNSTQPGDCNAYGLFEIGKRYMLILTENTHPRAYEQINSKDDLWYKVVLVIIKHIRSYER